MVRSPGVAEACKALNDYLSALNELLSAPIAGNVSNLTSRAELSLQTYSWLIHTLPSWVFLMKKHEVYSGK